LLSGPALKTLGTKSTISAKFICTVMVQIVVFEAAHRVFEHLNSAIIRVPICLLQ